MNHYLSGDHNGTTYILERSRAGSRKLLASAMPTYRSEPDYRIPLAKVPLVIRRAARASILGHEA